MIEHLKLHPLLELPNEPPEISGGGSNYAYGDELDLNCTSKPSYPPTKLTWYVNNEVANSRTSLVQESLSKTAEQLYYSESRLRMKVITRGEFACFSISPFRLTQDNSTLVK